MFIDPLSSNKIYEITLPELTHKLTNNNIANAIEMSILLLLQSREEKCVCGDDEFTEIKKLQTRK